MDDTNLIPEDWAAADEVGARQGFSAINREEQRADYARKHASLGDRMFRLLHELRPPRNCRERWRLQFERQEISEQEFFDLCIEHQRQPVDRELVESYYEELHERLNWLIKFWQAIMARNDDSERGLEATISSAQRDRYLKEVGGPGSLSQVQIDAIVRIVEQVRVERDWGLAVWGPYSEASGQLLLTTVRDVSRNRWQKAKELVREKHSDEFGRPLLTPEFLMKEAWVSPPFMELAALLRHEAAAVRLWLNPTSSTLPQAAGKTSRKSTASDPPERLPSNPIDFKNWGLGLEDGKRWKLFQRNQNRWDQRATILISPGHQTRLLTEFVRGGGSLLVKSAIELQRTNYPGLPDKKILELIKHTISDLRKTLRDAIAKVAKCSIDSAKNPLPLNGDRWVAQIEIGLAALDDDNQLRLQVQQSPNVG